MKVKLLRKCILGWGDGSVEKTLATEVRRGKPGSLAQQDGRQRQENP